MKIELHELSPDPDRFQVEVCQGLKRSQKELPSKYLYDERGSQLFEQICTLEEYYPTRTEAQIMAAHIEEMAELLGPGVLLLDYGSGSSAKARLLLDHLRDPAAYLPIDISREHLLRAAVELARDYPELEVRPIHADYTGAFELPPFKRVPTRRVAYYPGSTIGNFDPLPAEQFLERVAKVCGPGGALLIGIDLVKDPTILHRAYNDSQGVNAAFNLNLLRRINRELGADFELEQFKHYACYNPRERRVEMHLVSQQDQSVHLNGMTIHFEQGESIWTESSYKYTLERFAEIAGAAGFSIEQAWFDKRRWFSILYCRVQGA